MDTIKQEAQAKLVSKLLMACSTSTSLTAIEVLGALKVVETQVVMSSMRPTPAPKVEAPLIVKPGAMN